MAESRTRLRVRVNPGGGRDEVVGRLGDAWKVRVGTAPERGRANAAVLRLLAGRLGIASSQLAIVSGHGGRDKVVELSGLSAGEAARRMAAGQR
jgi:uncharacterized protein YggU (UPF0235/DUF167 family)